MATCGFPTLSGGNPRFPQKPSLASLPLFSTVCSTLKDYPDQPFCASWAGGQHGLHRSPSSFPAWRNSRPSLSSWRSQSVKAHFTKLDVLNMLWSVLLPLEDSTSFQSRVQGVTYAIPSLPFGWTTSPGIVVRYWRRTSHSTFRGKPRTPARHMSCLEGSEVEGTSQTPSKVHIASALG